MAFSWFGPKLEKPLNLASWFCFLLLVQILGFAQSHLAIYLSHFCPWRALLHVSSTGHVGSELSLAFAAASAYSCCKWIRLYRQSGGLILGPTLDLMCVFFFFFFISFLFLPIFLCSRAFRALFHL